VAETERKLACGALEGDARAFRALYDVAFRLSWAFTVRSTGDPRLAEAVTERALRRAFAELSELADGRTGLGALVLGCAGEALRELGPERAAPAPAVATATGTK
jgi:DNA-directed RNA polymerase specialized sigma24 family protein